MDILDEYRGNLNLHIYLHRERGLSYSYAESLKEAEALRVEVELTGRRCIGRFHGVNKDFVEKVERYVKAKEAPDEVEISDIIHGHTSGLSGA